jgi:hypothetical protein
MEHGLSIFVVRNKASYMIIDKLGQYRRTQKKKKRNAFQQFHREEEEKKIFIWNTGFRFFVVRNKASYIMTIDKLGQYRSPLPTPTKKTKKRNAFSFGGSY